DGIRDFHVTGVQTCALPIYGALTLIWQNPPTSPAELSDEADDLRRRRVRRQAQANPQGTVPDRNGSGGAVAGFNRSDRAALPEGRRRSSRLSADGDAACASAAELV